MKVFLIILKVVTAIILILLGILSLTNFKLEGIDLGFIHISAEAVNVFVDTTSDYIIWVYIAIVVFVLFRKKIKK